jgi:hypothetical protein
VPVLFDFERPTSRSFIETASTLCTSISAKALAWHRAVEWAANPTVERTVTAESAVPAAHLRA